MQTCQVLCVPFFCAGKQMFVYIRWTGRGRPAADACTSAKVQDCTDGYMFRERKLPSLCQVTAQLNTPNPSLPLFCLTTTESDPFYLFIYLLNYLLIPLLVWLFNDLPGGTGEMERFTSGTDDHSLHLLGK